jgi:hypothetical protein
MGFVLGSKISLVAGKDIWARAVPQALLFELDMVPRTRVMK